VHDLAYAEICFDGYTPPSVLQVPGAFECAIEFTSLSKSHAMAGWRVGFAAGNAELVRMLGRVKSYLDYGTFQPIQIATIIALDGPQDFVAEIVEDYRQRRNALCEGLEQANWKIEKPLGTMFVWAPIPERFADLGSLEFSKLLLEKSQVAVAPGVGFGPAGEGFVRFALVENTHRIRQAVRSMRKLLRDG
jgi:alanine-synthesizing transaminase